jgi:hypothetical protein
MSCHLTIRAASPPPDNPRHADSDPATALGQLMPSQIVPTIPRTPSRPAPGDNPCRLRFPTLGSPRQSTDQPVPARPPSCDIPAHANPSLCDSPGHPPARPIRTTKLDVSPRPNRLGLIPAVPIRADSPCLPEIPPSPMTCQLAPSHRARLPMGNPLRVPRLSRSAHLNPDDFPTHPFTPLGDIPIRVTPCLPTTPSHPQATRIDFPS